MVRIKFFAALLSNGGGIRSLPGYVLLKLDVCGVNKKHRRIKKYTKCAIHYRIRAVLYCPSAKKRYEMV